MSNSKKKSLIGHYHPAILSVWAAIICVGKLLPSIPMVGTGGNFSASSMLVPMAGILFGPIAGAICAAIGEFIGQLIAPNTAWMGIFTFLVGTCNALFTGFINRGKWIPGVVALVTVSLLWYLSPIGREVPLFPIVVNGLGCAATLIGGFTAKKWMFSKNFVLKAASIWLACFGGLITGAGISRMYSLFVMQMPATTFQITIFLNPIERAIFAAAAVVLSIPLLAGLPKIGIHVGPEGEAVYEESDE